VQPGEVTGAGDVERAELGERDLRGGVTERLRCRPFVHEGGGPAEVGDVAAGHGDVEDPDVAFDDRPGVRDPCVPVGVGGGHGHDVRLAA